MFNSENGVRAFIAIAGIIGLVIGILALFAPKMFFASSGIAIGDNASLLSEVRAPAALLLLLSSYLIWNIVTRGATSNALAITAAAYSSYGIARIFSWIVDGTPHNALIVAMGIELIIGSFAAFLWFKANKSENKYV